MRPQTHQDLRRGRAPERRWEVGAGRRRIESWQRSSPTRWSVQRWLRLRRPACRAPGWRSHWPWRRCSRIWTSFRFGSASPTSTPWAIGGSRIHCCSPSCLPRPSLASRSDSLCPGPTTLVDPVIRPLRRNGLARHPRLLHRRRARRRVSDPVLDGALLCSGSAAAGLSDRHRPLRARHPRSRGALPLAPLARLAVGSLLLRRVWRPRARNAGGRSFRLARPDRARSALRPDHPNEIAGLAGMCRPMFGLPRRRERTDVMGIERTCGDAPGSPRRRDHGDGGMRPA